MANTKLVIRLDGLFFQNLNPPQKNAVYANGILIPNGHFNQYNYTWGYKGGGPTSLTMGLLEVLKLDKKYHDQIYDIVAGLPHEKNFSRKIQIKL
jgi:hypothetical protein